MKLGIIGLPGSGKSTVFRSLTGGVESGEGRSRHEPGIGVVRVNDPRLQFLADYQKPKKVTPVHVEYLDIAGLTGEGKAGRELGDKVLPYIRPLDALIHCVRFFDSPTLPPPDPLKEWAAVEEEMILSDLAGVEKRLERVRLDVKRGRKESMEELRLLEEAFAHLEEAKPLRSHPPARESELLRGFAFLSSKPQLILLNVGEGKTHDEVNAQLDKISSANDNQPHVALDWLYADAEAEIARLEPEEAQEFLADLGLEASAKERIIRTSFDLLQLIVFFTVGEPEVRAWQLRDGLTAPKAAGTVHSDMERGFIRAEVVAFEDFRLAGSMQAAQKAAKVRLEGKDYQVRDGDIILFRFNV